VREDLGVGGAGAGAVRGADDAGNTRVLPFTVDPTSVYLGVVNDSQEVTITVTALHSLTDLAVKLDGPNLNLDSSTCTAVLEQSASCYMTEGFRFYDLNIGRRVYI
jgi:hypothetical protein